jgi:hypothetical protein
VAGGAEVDHQPGALAQTLEPLATAGVNLLAVMGYRLPGDRARAAIEVFPVIGAKALPRRRSAIMPVLFRRFALMTRRAPFATGLSRLFSRPFMRGSLRMRGFAAFAGNLALFIWLHRRKSPTL